MIWVTSLSMPITNYSPFMAPILLEYPHHTNKIYLQFNWQTMSNSNSRVSIIFSNKNWHHLLKSCDNLPVANYYEFLSFCGFIRYQDNQKSIIPYIIRLVVICKDDLAMECLTIIIFNANLFSGVLMDIKFGGKQTEAHRGFIH